MAIFLIIFIILFLIEVFYFRIAQKFNIVDKPNERSSHSTVVLRGGGIIFIIALWLWSIIYGFQYPWMLFGITLVAGVSFIDDIHSLPDSVRLVAQFAVMAMIFYEIGMLQWDMWWMVIIALIVCVGASNVINFMDGINGITGGYSLAVLFPLIIKNIELKRSIGEGFIDESFLIVVGLSLLVFCFFNFRPRGKAKCFAGDVGSVGIAYILLFIIGCVVMKTGDVTYLVFLIVYGVDGTLTICHRILLRENLGLAHRKHVYQIMANELKMNHVLISLIYMTLQLIVSLVFICIIPDNVWWHWGYLAGCYIVLSVVYILFKMKYYHLHEEYLAKLK